MVLDFVFGGSDLLEQTGGVLQHLGHHHYDCVFSFDGNEYHYRRPTDRPLIVFKCSPQFQPTAELSLSDYREFLRGGYAIPDDEGISFRGCVGPLSRIWGKENLNVKKPMFVVQKEREADALRRLAQVFGRFHVLRSLQQMVDERTGQHSTLSKAMNQDLIPKITKVVRRKNTAEIEQIDEELKNLRDTLALFAINVREVANAETIELTEAKDTLLRERFHTSARLAQLATDTAATRVPSPAKLEQLLDFFPNVNRAKILEVEAFHLGIAGILKKELSAERRNTKDRLKAIDDEIQVVNESLARTLSNVVAPTTIIDRVIRLSSKKSQLTVENDHHDDAIRLGEEAKKSKQILFAARKAEFTRISSQINNELRRLGPELFGPSRRPPSFKSDERSHSLHHSADKGTGTAFVSLLLFDLAMLNLTYIPFAIEDSLLFKNIENVVVGKLFGQYAALDKQVFVAIDEPSKFGPSTHALLRSRAVVHLSSDALLFDKDWRSQAADTGLV